MATTPLHVLLLILVVLPALCLGCNGSAEKPTSKAELWADAISPRFGSPGEEFTVQADALADFTGVTVQNAWLPIEASDSGLRFRLPEDAMGGRVHVRVQTKKGESNALPIYVRGADVWIPYLDLGNDILFSTTTHSKVVWTGKELLVWQDKGRGARFNPITQTWLELATEGGPGPRTAPAVVWTGERLIVWGGSDDTAPYVYSPFDDAWERGPDDGAPTPRQAPVAVWTGSELLVWGGRLNYTTPATAEGARYDLAARKWRTISSAGASGCVDSIWTGRYLLGCDARYEPATDNWTPIATPNMVFDHTPAPSDHPTVWTGKEMIVTGASATGRYDPENDTWRQAGTSQAPRQPKAWAWVGDRVLILGSYEFIHDEFDDPAYGTGLGGHDECVNLVVEYEPESDQWVRYKAEGWDPCDYEQVVWSGSQIYLMGPRATVNTGLARLDIQNRSVEEFPAPLLPAPFLSKTAWLGTELAVWSNGFDTFSVYDPVRDTWTAVPPPNAVSSSYEKSAIAAGGGRLLVAEANIAAGTAGLLFNAAKREWRALPSPDAATQQALPQVAVWDGTRFLAWDYQNGTTLPAGWRYDPVTETWSHMTIDLHTPFPKGPLQAVWSGKEMIVWGGYDLYKKAPGKVGGRYDSQTDHWVTMSLADAPNSILDEVVAWAGSAMVVWGGGYNGDTRNAGWLYDPTGDTWQPMSTHGAPSPRSSAVAVWSGKRLIVAGGEHVTSDSNDMLHREYFRDAAAYDLATDTWAPLADFPAGPLGPATGVWNGREIFTYPGGMYIP